MSTGISISSINLIKELAEEKKYAEALEILDTQNLDKSINPQFLRISGEIFRENKRYYDSRRILLKSHEMSPQGTRIIAELIQLYLELGYFTRAKKYYDQYLFYSTEEDTQRDYVEYMYKKATGTDIKELASILIPILETMPEDKWNFEAVLLYHKLDRKDKALEEAQYILENFKESDYIKPVIEYIDDKLDVDQYFNIYPKEEVPEDKELYGDLIEKEEKILEADHYRMYPPEAKIIVEVEDKDAIEIKPPKEKKPRKKREKRNKSDSVSKTSDDDLTSDKNEKPEKKSDDKSDIKNDEKSDSKSSDIISKSDKDDNVKADNKDNKSDIDKQSSDNDQEKANNSTTPDNDEEAEKKRLEEAEETRKQEREAALDKILARKIDKSTIKESAKQMVKNVGQDTKKAREQVKKVTGSVIDNVQKATDSVGDAVGTSKVQQVYEEPSEEFVDGIIESIIEPPKKSVGEVVTNEELDALVPDSLEAMSSDEVAEIEARKEEQERIELEELEASVQAEESKRNRKNKKKNDKDESQEDSNKSEESEKESEDIIVVDTSLQNEAIASVTFAELKERFLAANEEKEDEEEKPLESLGFMTVVQSDVDEKMENDAPEAAEILHRMIDNKEYYTGEDSRGFESKASYENHGFEVEDYEINEYIQMSEQPEIAEQNERLFKVDDIFTENQVLDFEEIIPESDEVFKVEESDEAEPDEVFKVEESDEAEPEIEELKSDTEIKPNIESEPIIESDIEIEEEVEPEAVTAIEREMDPEPEPVAEPEVEPESEPAAEIEEEAEPEAEPESEPAAEIEEEAELEVEPESEPTVEIEEEAEPKPDAEEISTDVVDDHEILEETELDIADTEKETEPDIEQVFDKEPDSNMEQKFSIESESESEVRIEPDSQQDYRQALRVRIVLTDSMIRGLLDLKESR